MKISDLRKIDPSKRETVRMLEMAHELMASGLVMPERHGLEFIQGKSIADIVDVVGRVKTTKWVDKETSALMLSIHLCGCVRSTAKRKIGEGANA